MDLRDKDKIASISPLSRKGLNYHHVWLRNRELGRKQSLGTTDRMYREMYSTIRPISRWESSMSSKVALPGGIFNLEFSPDGSIMAAACEKRSILLFDPVSQMYLHSIDNAHSDCVNCVRFLDSRMFATCSDDKTVAIWDTRNLKTRIRVLNGHENWVKNVEYSKDDKLLVTSGFDGSIFTWDINSYTERGLLYKRVFHTSGLMRMKLLSDASKMVICTTGGYIMVIHNLNLETLATDLHGFKPNMYRLMQMSETTIPVATKFTYLFKRNRKRNRIEFIVDFPQGDEAEVISSLQIHPQGWCAVTRNVTTDEQSEWTCVHDIQGSSCNSQDSDLDTKEEESSSLPNTTRYDHERSRPHPSANSSDNYEVFPPEDNAIPSSDVWEALLAFHESRDRPSVLLGIPPYTHNVMTNGVRIVRMASGIEDQYLYEEEVNSSDANSSNNSNDSQSTSYNPNSPNDNPSHSESDHMLDNSDASNHESSSSYSRGGAIIIVGPCTSSNRRYQNKNQVSNSIPSDQQVHRNVNRLTHYIEETNAGKGFIKEIGFSEDGRIICSPFSYGIRLLAFNESCSEMSTCINDNPIRLHEVGTSTVHGDIVLSTKFSSRHCLLASGCQAGNIIWYQPVL